MILYIFLCYLFISKKYKQLVINAIGAIGYFGLIFGLTIAIVSVLDWFSLVELSPIDHQLTVNDGRPGEAIRSIIPTSVTYFEIGRAHV